MRKHKIPMKKVQVAFSNAIKRRDCRCMVKDYEPCFGGLECSHFFTQGSSPSLMFYPPNAYAQCQKHHWKHHNGKVAFYENWLVMYHAQDWLKMQRLRHCILLYTDELKAEIIRLCNADKLEELTELIEDKLIGGR